MFDIFVITLSLIKHWKRILPCAVDAGKFIFVQQLQLWPEIPVISTDKTLFIECFSSHRNTQLELMDGHNSRKFVVVAMDPVVVVILLIFTDQSPWDIATF